MAKYIKSFETTAAMLNYYQSADPGYYLLRDESGVPGNSKGFEGKRITNVYKPVNDYLTLTARENSSKVKINKNRFDNDDLKYSLDGVTWQPFENYEETFTLNTDEFIKLKGKVSENFTDDPITVTAGSFNLSGSLSSIYNENPDQDTEDQGRSYRFMRLFKGNIYDASEFVLPLKVATSQYAYTRMFEDCPNLHFAPREIMLEEVPDNGMETMFKNCTYIEETPILHCTSVKGNGLSKMFQGCTGLVTITNFPVTEFDYSGSYHCYEMFEGCSSLVNVPDLPATVGGYGGYFSMFKNCTSLVNGPEIFVGPDMRGDVFNHMFEGCTSLTSVTHHIEHWPSYNAEDWLKNVAASGTVTCSSTSDIPSDSTSGIPTGWTRVDL